MIKEMLSLVKYIRDTRRAEREQKAAEYSQEQAEYLERCGQFGSTIIRTLRKQFPEASISEVYPVDYDLFGTDFFQKIKIGETLVAVVDHTGREVVSLVERVDSALKEGTAIANSSTRNHYEAHPSFGRLLIETFG